jgi:hypothetical protein
VSAPPVAPSPPAGAKAPSAPEAPSSPAAPPGPDKPAAAKAPDAPKADDAEAKRLSGKHWQKIADEKWSDPLSKDKLSDDFKPKVTAFLKMLTDNGIKHEVTASLRPPQRSYLFHYCLEIASGREKDPKNVPKETGVDINWDHGDLAKSKAAAEELATAFGLSATGVAAHPSNHNKGDAIDLKFDFSKNTKDGKNALAYMLDGKDVKREIQIDDEATIGKKASDKTIANIEDRELSKAGADFGLMRQIDNDIVHWSLTGR